MGCCDSAGYKAPPTPNLSQLYDQEQGQANSWAQPNANTAYNVYSSMAPQYQNLNNQMAGQQQAVTNQANTGQMADYQNMINQLGSLSPRDKDLADQNSRAGMAARGNINGDANIGQEVMGRSDYANQRVNQKLGQMGSMGGFGNAMAGYGTALPGAQSAANGLNYFNPNSGPIGQQAGLSLYQGQTQNAQNKYQSDQANNPFTMALSALGSIGKIAGPAMAMGI